MTRMFLSYPVKKNTTKEDMQRIQGVMKANYDAVTGTHNSYRSNRDFAGIDSLYNLGKSLQNIASTAGVVVHPDWLKDSRCKEEVHLAEVYGYIVFYLDEARWNLIEWISAEVEKPTVRAKILNLCDERSIWTKELFAKINISELAKVKGMGPITIRTLKDLQQKIQTS